MNIRDLIGKRILVKIGIRFNGGDVQEIRIVEISPSGNWAKVMNLNGNKFWKQTSEIALVEVLTDLHGEPKPE